MRPVKAILADLQQQAPPPGAGIAPGPAAGSCPQCGGSGLLRHDVPLGHPLFGSTVECACSAARARDRVLADLRARGNLRAFADKTFHDFTVNHPAVRPLFQAANHFAARLTVRDPATGWLVLLGPPGCGKTHLAAATANAAIAAGIPAYFTVVPDLLDALRGGYERVGDSLNAQLDLIRTVDLLVLDDLGAENPTGWAREKLYQIVNHRYNYRGPTIITLNCPLDTLDPRLASRLCDRALCTQVIVEGEPLDLDYRWTGGR